MQTIMTLEQLVKFCKKRHFYKFDAKDDNKRILVQVPAVFSTDEDESDEFTLFGKVKLLHTGKNRNGSNVTKEAAEDCLETIKYKPLLANFCEVDDEMDFTSHDMEIDEDGNITYIEHQVGCFTAEEAYLEEDEDNGKTYIIANVAIPREYTETASIIERKGGTKISAELFIKKMEYDLENDELILQEIEVLGATCLGKNPETGENVEEGMEGAFLEVKDSDTEEQYADFYKKYVGKEEQPVKIKYDENGEVIEEADKKEFEGEEAEVEEVEDEEKPTDEAEDNDAGSDEDNEEEEVSDDDASEEESEDNDEADEEADDEEEADDNDDDAEADEGDVESSDDASDGDSADSDSDNSFSVNFKGATKTFAISLDDIQMNLTEKVNDEYENDNVWYWIEIFPEESYVVMHSWSLGHFRQDIEKDEDGYYSLIGERVEVSPLYVTKEEEALIKDTLATAREAAREDERYAHISDTAEFKELLDDDSLSIAEFKEKADKLLLAYYEENNGKTQKFSSKKIASPFNKKSKSARYGTLFNK